MSDQDRDQKTEEATPSKKDKLRKEGKVVKSQDVIGAVVVGSVGLCFAAVGSEAAMEVMEFASRAFQLRDGHQPLVVMGAVIPVLTVAALPVVAVAMLTAAAAGAVQTRGLFTLKALEFKPERLNPIPQLKNVFPSKQSLLELGKNLLKIVALGAVIYNVVADASSEFTVLAASSPAAAAGTVGAVVTKVAIHGSIAFALVAAVDYWIANRRFREENKMSKQDIKDEHKEQDGRPEVKQRMRRMMRELGKRRAVAEVKNASVLVCNPTHIAVALRYNPDVDAAPMLLAKGIDHVALRMRNEARKHGVPIVENRPFARALNTTGKVGRAIPVELYRAAAGVVAHVMQLRGARA